MPTNTPAANPASNRTEASSPTTAPTPAPTRASARWPAAVVAALALLAALGHFSGLDARLPCAPANDEHVYVWHLALFGEDEARRDRDPSYGFYPHLVSRLAACLPSQAGGPAPETEAGRLRAAGDDFRRARTVVALLALLAIPATWLVAREILSPVAALLAAALVAASPLFAWHASEARPHAAFGALVWLALAMVVRAHLRGGARRWLLAGAATGLALATLQSGLLLLPALFVAHASRGALQRRGEGRWLAAALLLALALALPFYPFLLHTPERIGEGPPPGASSLSGHDVWLGAFDGSGFKTVLDAFFDYEPVALAAATAGALAALAFLLRSGLGPLRASLRGAPIVVLAFAVPYLTVFGLYQRTYPRFVIPLIPALALLAAWAVERGSDLAARRMRGRAAEDGARAGRLLPASAAAIALLAFLPAIGLARLRSRPDTAQEAASWIAERVDRSTEELAIVPSLDLPLLRRQDELPPGFDRIGSRSSPWRWYQASLPEEIRRAEGWSLVDLSLISDDARRRVVEDPEAFVRGLGVDYVVVEPWDRPVLRELKAWLVERAELVARFGPSQDPDDWRPFLMHDSPAAYGDEACWAARLLAVDRLGTVVEIFRILPAAGSPR